MCGIINTYFFMLAHKLKKYYNLSEQEIKLCILVLLDQNQVTKPYNEEKEDES